MSDLLGDCIALEPDPALAQERAARRAEVRAIRTQTRARMSRASSEDALRAALPPLIADGETWHVISQGNVDGLSYVAHQLAHLHADHLILSTWCMALDDVRQLDAWLQAGTVRRLDVYVGEIFPSQYAEAFALLCQVVRESGGGGRVAVFRNHAKVAVIANHASNYYTTLEASCNLNTNPRNEQATVTRDRSLAAFYRDFFDGVRSIVRNFPDWTPHGWPPA